MGRLQIPTAIQSTMPFSKIVVVSAAVFGTSYSSALFVPAPVFQHLEGACRTAELNTGTFHTLQGISRSDCEFECIRDPNCVAYEHNSRGQCEIHSEAITQTARSFGTACYIKSQFEPEPEIVFCAGDVFECPGVSGFFVSRDPGNNCEFKGEECPQVQPKPEPEIVFCAGAVFECPGVGGFFVSRDPGNNCEFKVEECPQVQPKPECDPFMLCLAQETCVDGKLYATSCGPKNCAAPIADTCERPAVDPSFYQITYGTCRSHNLHDLAIDECQRAAAKLHFDIKHDYTSSNFPDVVDSCSVRGGNQLFFNTRGTCDTETGSDSWAFRGCECSDLNPCLCAARLD